MATEDDEFRGDVVMWPYEVNDIGEDAVMWPLKLMILEGMS